MIICAIGSTEIILIAAVVLLIFGGKKIPELMKGLGQGVRQFKNGMREPLEDDVNSGGTSTVNKEEIRQERLELKRRQLEQEGIKIIEYDFDSRDIDSANPNAK